MARQKRKEKEDKIGGSMNFEYFNDSVDLLCLYTAFLKGMITAMSISMWKK